MIALDNMTTKNTISLISLKPGIYIMHLELKESKAIKLAWYDNTILFIQFHNGTVYCYDLVTTEELADWKNAESTGKWFNTYIKGQKPYFQLNTDS